MKESFSMLEPPLFKLAKRTRSNLSSDIMALIPIFLQVGTDDIPREIYEAVRDVTTWWP
jgi:hypothetical protein